MQSASATTFSWCFRKIYNDDTCWSAKASFALVEIMTFPLYSTKAWVFWIFGLNFENYSKLDADKIFLCFWKVFTDETKSSQKVIFAEFETTNCSLYSTKVSVSLRVRRNFICRILNSKLSSILIQLLVLWANGLNFWELFRVKNTTTFGTQFCHDRTSWDPTGFFQREIEQTIVVQFRTQFWESRNGCPISQKFSTPNSEQMQNWFLCQ